MAVRFALVCSKNLLIQLILCCLSFFILRLSISHFLIDKMPRFASVWSAFYVFYSQVFKWNLQFTSYYLSISKQNSIINFEIFIYSFVVVVVFVVRKIKSINKTQQHQQEQLKHVNPNISNINKIFSSLSKHP